MRKFCSQNVRLNDPKSLGIFGIKIRVLLAKVYGKYRNIPHYLAGTKFPFFCLPRRSSLQNIKCLIFYWSIRLFLVILPVYTEIFPTRKLRYAFSILVFTCRERFYVILRVIMPSRKLIRVNTCNYVKFIFSKIFKFMLGVVFLKHWRN